MASATLVARFDVTERQCHHKEPGGIIVLEPVIGFSYDSDNRLLWPKGEPHGHIELDLETDEALAFFRLGRELFVRFSNEP
jgi:hypothetical protein